MMARSIRNPSLEWRVFLEETPLAVGEVGTKEDGYEKLSLRREVGRRHLHGGYCGTTRNSRTFAEPCRYRRRRRWRKRIFQCHARSTTNPFAEKRAAPAISRIRSSRSSAVLPPVRSVHVGRHPGHSRHGPHAISREAATIK